MAIRSTMKSFIGKRLARSARVAVAAQSTSDVGHSAGTVVPSNTTAHTDSAGRCVELNTSSPLTTGNPLYEAQMEILARQLARKDLSANSVNLVAGNPLLDAQMEILTHELARKDFSHLVKPALSVAEGIPALQVTPSPQDLQAIEAEAFQLGLLAPSFTPPTPTTDMSTSSYGDVTEADLSHAGLTLEADMTAEFGYDDKLQEYDAELEDAANCSYDRRMAELIAELFPQDEQANVFVADVTLPCEFEFEDVAAEIELMLAGPTNVKPDETDISPAAVLVQADVFTEFDADISAGVEMNAEVSFADSTTTDFSYASDTDEADVTVEFGYEDQLAEIELALAFESADTTEPDFSHANDTDEADMTSEFDYDDQLTHIELALADESILSDESTDSSYANESNESDMTAEFGYDEILTEIELALADESDLSGASTDFSHANDSNESDMTAEFGYDDQLTDIEFALSAVQNMPASVAMQKLDSGCVLETVDVIAVKIPKIIVTNTDAKADEDDWHAAHYGALTMS